MLHISCVVSGMTFRWERIWPLSIIRVQIDLDFCDELENAKGSWVVYKNKDFV